MAMGLSETRDNSRVGAVCTPRVPTRDGESFDEAFQASPVAVIFPRVKSFHGALEPQRRQSSWSTMAWTHNKEQVNVFFLDEKVEM